ncbi:pilus assembly protein [Bifidobacterium sp. 79T10]|nr:TadE/TadG family type IV pilus assembly protein [Bifidobacterium saguinibicoloris]MBW3080329.1 pilus assembly protein [Bifidobacterium saguinibicoloris]
MLRRARRPPSRPSAHKATDASDPGTVTAEFAVVLPVVAALAILLLSLTRVAAVQISCQDAASAAARAAVAASRSDPQAAASAAAGKTGVSADVVTSGDTVTVTTSCPVVPDPMGVLPVRVTGRAVGVTA